MTELTELRRVAEAATPGPWRAEDPTEWDGTPQAAVCASSGLLTWDDHGGEVFKPEDAAHIATFDPPTVLELLGRLEAAEKVVAGFSRAVPATSDLLVQQARAEASLYRELDGTDAVVDALVRMAIVVEESRRILSTYEQKGTN